MQRTMYVATSVLTAMLLMTAPSFAAQQGVLPPEKTQGAVTYVSGGIGTNEIQAFQAAAAHYPLTLEFAIKHMPRAEFTANVVDVSIMNKPYTVCVEVADTGPGIPPEDLTRVFDRFYRRAAPGIPGSGLGLAIVKTIAERHHATVSLGARASGTGLVVRVTFPQA